MSRRAAPGPVSAGPPWYANGLQFTCTRCGNCCTGAPGFTWLSDTEVDALAAFLKKPRTEVERTLLRRVWRDGVERWSLTEKKNHDCIFFKKGVGCTVYEARPQQCRTWPFWRRNLVDEASWNDLADECPGINKGRTHDAETIAAIASDDGLPG